MQSGARMIQVRKPVGTIKQLGYPPTGPSDGYFRHFSRDLDRGRTKPNLMLVLGCRGAVIC